MASISETGHAGNVANFEALIIFATASGASYNPSNDSLKIPALQSLLSASKEALNAVNMAQSSYSNAVAAREVAFEPLSKLITRVNNALKASGTTVQVDESAQTIVRKLQGRRAKAKITDEEMKTLQAEGKEVNQISVAQLSYDNRIENFSRLITLLETVPYYKPNEEDLRITTLKSLLDGLKAKNNDAVTAAIHLNNTRITRNELMYKPLTGLVDTAFDFRVYIRSVFGAKSPQYKQISKLKFSTI